MSPENCAEFKETSEPVTEVCFWSHRNKRYAEIHPDQLSQVHQDSDLPFTDFCLRNPAFTSMFEINQVSWAHLKEEDPGEVETIKYLIKDRKQLFPVVSSYNHPFFPLLPPRELKWQIQSSVAMCQEEFGDCNVDFSIIYGSEFNPWYAWQESKSRYPKSWQTGQTSYSQILKELGISTVILWPEHIADFLPEDEKHHFRDGGYNSHIRIKDEGGEFNALCLSAGDIDLFRKTAAGLRSSPDLYYHRLEWIHKFYPGPKFHVFGSDSEHLSVGYNPDSNTPPIHPDYLQRLTDQINQSANLRFGNPQDYFARYKDSLPTVCVDYDRLAYKDRWLYGTENNQKRGIDVGLLNHATLTSFEMFYTAKSVFEHTRDLMPLAEVEKMEAMLGLDYREAHESAGSDGRAYEPLECRYQYCLDKSRQSQNMSKSIIAKCMSYLPSDKPLSPDALIPQIAGS